MFEGKLAPQAILATPRTPPVVAAGEDPDGEHDMEEAG
jgi:hypothetical protein